MNIIPLVVNNERKREEVRDIEIQISSDWWSTTYSVQHKINDVQKHITNEQERLFKNRNSSLPNTPGWNVGKGDYKVKESKVNAHDYLYYRDLKIKIVKFSIYPVVAITVIIIITILKMITKI